MVVRVCGIGDVARIPVHVAVRVRQQASEPVQYRPVQGWALASGAQQHRPAEPGERPILVEGGGLAGVAVEQGQRGRLVHDDPAQQLLPDSRELERDDRPARVPGNPRRRDVKMLHERREVLDVLAETALPWPGGRSLSL